MAAKSQEHGKHVRHGRGRSRRVWIARMTHYPKHAVFGERTGRPRFSAFGCKPIVRPIMLHVRRVNQSNENIHIQQIPSQDNSSCS